MRRRRLLLGVGAMAFLGVAGFALFVWLTSPTPRPSRPAEVFSVRSMPTSQKPEFLETHHHFFVGNFCDSSPFFRRVKLSSPTSTRYLKQVIVLRKDLNISTGKAAAMAALAATTFA